MSDKSYEKVDYSPGQLKHLYGENIFISHHPWALSLLAKLGRQDVIQPEINTLIKEAYRLLIAEVFSNSFPKEIVSEKTRMFEATDKAVFTGEVLKRDQKIVCVDIARAGIIPSQLCFDQSHLLFDPAGIRQDHFYMNRKVNDSGEVIGVDFSGSKVGGDVDDSIVLIPDPMGATGTSIAHVIDYYKENVEGKAKKIIALHLIVTPEYIAKLKIDHPEVEVWTLRLDRGLSDLETLNSTPGSNPILEKGLNEVQYIVPGLGGVGEIINNSFV